MDIQNRISGVKFVCFFRTISPENARAGMIYPSNQCTDYLHVKNISERMSGGYNQ